MGYNEWSYKSSSPLLGLPVAGRLGATNCHEFSHGRSSGRWTFNGRRNTDVYVCVRLTVSVKSAALREEPRRLGYPKLLRVVRAFASESWTDGTRTQFAWDLPSAEGESQSVINPISVAAGRCGSWMVTGDQRCRGRGNKGWARSRPKCIQSVLPPTPRSRSRLCEIRWSLETARRAYHRPSASAPPYSLFISNPASGRSASPAA